MERTTHFAVLLKNDTKRSTPVMAKIATLLRDLPHHARRSITFDRCTEFVSWPHLRAEIGTASWFCDPSAPWQKGTVLNADRRIRRWLPRELPSPSTTGSTQRIGCRTPAAVLRQKMLENRI
ncbi:IS30 family transposase [Cereibacter sp. SYSU M97828]|nr:IS30 family transposase [Cereibacter flavus]